ncbi:MAG: MptD family putative ECF transporter S component [Parasporobacterium sp.]|nr:MptD family putative ECF transporter S component [Parasporobacterium sp.]
MNDSKIFKKLEGKDLISIGIFTAIYAVITFVIAILGMVPIFLLLLSVLVPIVGGIIFELYLTKVKKFGMITIMGVLMGLIMLLTGMGIVPLITGIVFGVIADLVYSLGRFSSAKCAVLANGFFSMIVWGNYYELFFNAENYWASRQDFGQDYIDAVSSLLPTWMCPTLLAIEFVCGLIGGLLGKALMKKHFKKAGIA